MVIGKTQGIGGPFCKWLPLQIVPPNEIPAALDNELMAQVTASDLAYLGSLMANLCLQKNGVGLSAVQVGIPLPFFVASENQNDFIYLYYCEYEGTDNKISSIEGCLSLLDKSGQTRRFLLSRYKTILCKGKKVVSYGDRIQLEGCEVEYDGFMSIVRQHEIDHHNFKLISELGKEIQII